MEREVRRPAKCVDSFEDGFGEITPPQKSHFNKNFLCKLAKGANSAEFHCHRIPLLGEAATPNAASYSRSL